MTDWRPVEGFPHYEVSSEGDVRSSARGGLKVLRARINPDGYPSYNLSRDGQVTTFRLHQLMAAAFLGPRPSGQEVRHLDGDPLNRALSNLQWGTKSENALDQVRHGTHANASKPTCKRGHSTFVVQANGKRGCRTCRHEANRRWRERQASHPYVIEEEL